jgi:hypothetical protein
VQVRSPKKSKTRRRALARGAVGGLLCVSAFAAAALVVTLVVRPAAPSPGKTKPIAGLPDGSALAQVGVEERRRGHRDRPAKKHRHARRRGFVATDVQVLGRLGVAVPQAHAAPARPAAPVAEPTPAPARPKPRLPHVKRPGTTAPTTPLPAASTAQQVVAASTGLVRLSVNSMTVAPDATNTPELVVKLGVAGAQPTDAVPDTVTLHLRPQVPAQLPKDDPTLALNARLDMVEAPRTAATDPALRMRVRMAIAPAAAGTPVVQEPGPGDGKSNVIALTVGLDSFTRTPDGDTPPDPAPDQPAPGDPGPGEPGPTDPAPQPGPTDPAPQPTPGDPAPQPGPTDPAPQPTPGDPAPEPTPTDPAPQPAPGNPAPQPTPPATPPAEIVIPIGPQHPNEGTTTVPVTPGGGADAPALDPIPIDVVIEELPPLDPSTDPGDVPTAGVQDPAVEVPPPPADAAPDAPPGTTDTSASAPVDVLATDAGPAPAPDTPS